MNDTGVTRKARPAKSPKPLIKRQGCRRPGMRPGHGQRAREEQLVERSPHESQQSQGQGQRLPKDCPERRRQNLSRRGERVIKHECPFFCALSGGLLDHLHIVVGKPKMMADFMD